MEQVKDEVNIEVVGNSDEVLQHEQELRKVVDEVFVQVHERLGSVPQKVVIKEAEHPEFLVDLDGVGGYCPSSDYVEVSLDFSHPSFRDGLPTAVIKKTLAHESHHAARRLTGTNLEASLLESALSEGMADYFVYELFGATPKWTSTADDKILAQLIDEFAAEAENDVTQENYTKWFLRGTDNIPKWFGYALGFKLVSSYLATHPHQTIKSLTKNTAKDLLKSSDWVKFIM